MRIAVCPGSFDPITVGHLDLAERAAAIFDRVILCVMVNGEKHPMFSLEERLELARAASARLPNVEAAACGGLLADFAREHGACALVKGVRGQRGLRLGTPAGPDQPGPLPRAGHDPPDRKARTPACQFHYGAGNAPLPAGPVSLYSPRRPGRPPPDQRRKGMMVLWQTTYFI